ncbi:MAG: DUF1932 domain-containing protein [Burkholderiaceae bacterium]
MTSILERVILIGFGEVGQALYDDLAKAGQSEVQVYDLLFSDPDSVPARAAKSRGLAMHDSATAAILAPASGPASMIICAVTAAADLDAAQACAQAIPAGCLYADLNSASPGVKQQASQLIDAAGGAYVEAAVMSPIFPKRITSPMLLGGAHAEAFKTRATALGFSGTQVHSATVGKASATKMCRSVVIKGMEALLTESMLAARHYGVEDGVLDSFTNLLPSDDWHKFARYMISRSIEHGGRRAEEMREVVKTVEQAGVDPWMSAACVERQQWAPRHTEALVHESLGPFLDAMRANLTKQDKQ